MSNPVHLRFLGGTIYCSVRGSRVKLDADHRYGDAYTCPGCGYEEPARNWFQQRRNDVDSMAQVAAHEN